MFFLLRALLALDLAAVGCEQFSPSTRTVLPLGGSQLAQLGLILIIVVIFNEAQVYIRHVRSHIRRRRRRLDAQVHRADAARHDQGNGTLAE